jgi:hypothetical protein
MKWLIVGLACGLAIGGSPAEAQLISSGSIRPFVIGIVPVVGPSGAVGGVSIDAKGVLARSDVDAMGLLREARLRAAAGPDSDLQADSIMRKVSLRRLVAAIDERRKAGKPIDDALQNVAGLMRVEYIFAYPEHNDIVIAGPAEGWEIDEQGNALGRNSRQPVLQLDDLVVALRTAKAAGMDRGISCSIDPTDEGLRRVQPLLASARGASDATVARLERALGPQQIAITGVPSDSHFARVLVAADFLMKRLGMGFEPAPIDKLPSYLSMLANQSATPKNAMPRWWMAPRYEPLLKDAEGLAWQLRGSGVQTLTEDGYLGAAGAAVEAGRADPLAKKWANAMTDNYATLAKAMPVFGELRNCMDLAVVAALLVKEDLPAKTGCDLSLLLDEKQIGVAQYNVPKTVDSRASLIRKGREWILSLSGGVQVDSWSVVSRVETRNELSATRQQAAARQPERWWWD